MSTDTTTTIADRSSVYWTQGGTKALVRDANEAEPRVTDAQQAALDGLRRRLKDGRILRVRRHRSWGVTLAVTDKDNITEFSSHEGRDLDAAIELAQAGRGL